MSGRNKSADYLHQWAINEMHFVPCGRYVNAPMPTIQDFTTVCRGNLLDIWEFITTYVQSAQHVHTIKSNLLLKARNKTGQNYQVKYKGDRKYSEQRAEKMERKRALLAQLTQTKSDVNHLSREVDRTMCEIGDKETEYQDGCSQVMDMERKATLLYAHSEECKADIDRYDNYRKRLENRLTEIQQPLRSSTSQTIYFSKHGREGSTGDEESGLETASTKFTREMCEDIEKRLHDLVLGQEQLDERTIQQRRDAIRSKMEQLFPTKTSSQQLLHSISQTTEGACHLLRQMTTIIDLKKDAQTLKFKYEDNGRFVDISPKPNLMKTVQQLIQGKQLAHINKFTETQKILNQAWRLDKRLEQLAVDVNGRLAVIYAANPGELQLAKKLFCNEMELSAMTSLIKSLHQIMQELRESATKAVSEKEELYNKYRQIQDFNKVTEQKQSMIQLLVQNNSEAKKRLNEQQRELLRYMQTTLCGHEAGTVAMTTHLRNGIISEIERFAGLPLQMLRMTQLDSGQKVPIFQLSINRLTDQSAMSGGGAFLDILSQLNFPLYKSPESALPYVMDMKCETTSIELHMYAQQSLYDDMSGIHTQDSTTIQHIAALVEEVARHDKKQLSRILPMLQDKQSEATQGLQDCIRVKDQITAWWEQPSQNLIPWVKLDDKSLQQWLDTWTVAVTRLRQVAKH